MVRHDGHDVGDDVDDATNRAWAVEDGRRTANHVDLRHADRRQGRRVRRIVGSDVAHAESVFQHQDFVFAQPTEDGARRRRAVAAYRYARKVRDLLREARAGTVQEVDLGLGGSGLVDVAGRTRIRRSRHDDLLQWHG